MIHTDAHTMGRTYKLGVAILVLLSCVLSGGNAQTSTCTSILNCKSCSSNICLQCNDGYATNREGTGCCSKGCSKDADGYHQCNIGNGICTYQDCESGYFGPTCAACGTQIENCDDCDYVSGSTILHCTACGTGYFRTSNNQQCCPEGCDSCNGDVCLTCKVGYFLYLDRCDTCGNNCQSPANGSARCDPVNGHCYYGCLDGWHGSTCNVPCTISRCETCDYIEAADFLRCADCENGYYGNNCQRCSENCLVQTQQICNQLGRCDSGCQPGWRLDNCDRRCSNETGMANCLSCERYNFKCTLCQPGFWGPTCQYRCSDNCSPNDLAQHKCNILDGSCDLGCLPGHYQADCRLNCPNCGGGDRCNITTGICLDRVCDPGYYGTACVNQCPPTCAVNPSSNLVCDFNDGSCPNGCQPDYYGAFCQLSCSQYCSRNNIQNGPVCRQSDGYCFSACEAGYYNVNCNATCISRCVDNTCDIISGGCAECDKTNPGYLCPYGKCTDGYWGTFCNSLCPDHCQSTCNRDTSICDACVDGRFGSICNLTCGNCLSGTCDKVSGMCESPCIQGWWGPYCNTTCLYPGCKECDQETGLCTACRIGQFGENCERQCSDKCTPSVDGNVACDRNTGNCEQGSCLPGYYNLNCTGECSPNCFPDNNGVLVCALMTGYCPNGCPPTLTGNFCNEQCSVFCTDNLCYQNGTCQIGCVNNRYGEQCQTECISTCNDNTCDRKSGICEECLKPAEDQTALCRSAECPSGFTGQFCNISCPDNCFSKCNRYTSNCQSCSTGYYGNTCAQDCGKCLEVACVQNNGTCLSSCIDGFYGDRCNQACEYEQCKSCYRDTGSCLECDAGYWGENCEKNCSSQCVASSDGFVYCSKTTGDCTVGACLPGYYTEDCTMSCHENCRPRANGMTYCDFETGRCSNGCLDGFYGDHCNFTCSGNCQGGVCERDGACLRSLGCAIGYYGTMCNSVCVSTCNDNTCNRDEGGCDECKKAPAVQSPLCRSAECNPNNLGGYFHGQLCNISCPDNCASSCGRYTSVCVSCQSGFWSGECDQSCGSCSEVTCFQSNGTCQSDCLDGFYGAMCNLPCKHSGCRTCDRVSGECVVCKPSFWGDNCDRDCSQRCAFSDDGNIYCDKANSNCDLSECQTGFYNLNCTGVCNENCLPLNTGSGVCNFFTGECSYGCFNGFYGPSCQFPCSPTCRESTCDRNGRCNEFLGCDRGFFGFSCENQCIVTCSDGTCDRDSGNCTECGKPAEEQTPLCRSAECPVGLHGLFCNQSCPDNCLDRKCGRYSAICDACVDDFWGASCDTACGNCVGDKCRQDDGFCENGCDDGYYGDKCMTSCTYEGCQSCGSDGECLDCKPGLFRERCDRTCSRNCVANTTDGNIYCSKQTGACAMQQCTSGFYTPQCTQSCNENCGIKSDGSRSCDIYTGSCDLDCELTYYGQSCDLKCPETCLNQDCDRTGNCRQGCQVGYWDPTCGTECQEAFTCNVGTCDITSGTCLECDNEFPTPLCRTADCPTGLHGLFCNMSCPANCANNICDRYTGLCATCRNGFYGPACESACPNCKNNVCFKTSGECVQGCLDGWYTAKCDQSCLFTGCQNCDRQSGLCIECKAGFYGDNDCNRTCSARCAITDGTPITCNKFSGACDSQQCIAGYWTEQCTRECSQYCQTDTCALGTGTCSPCLVGWYNQRCTGECSDRCRNKNCSIEADLCNQGCTDGFWGGRCENDCSVNCAGRACNKDSAECLNGCIDNLYYGSTCNTPCNGNCIDNVCNTTGYCLRGCEVGYYGDKCQFTCASVSKCVDGTCDRIVGTCSDCLSSSPGPNCPTADCLPGKRGVDCEDDCSSTMCLYNKCDRYGNRCLGCPLQRWGVLCENVCSNCREGTQCDQDTGVCLEGCRDGYYKDDCNTPCRDVCSRCGRQDGVCIECTAGRWGPSCDNICSSNCLPTYDVNTMRVYCDKETAACDAAACQPGYWQANCTRPCGQNCKVNSAGFRSCSLLNGQCDEGCVDTYFGPTCSGVCSERCRNRLCKDFSNSCVLGCAEGYYGSTCGSTCSSQCAGAGGCDPRNGTCYEGCNSGYFGSRCDRQCINSCTDGTCASDGGCDDCKTDPIGPLCRAQVCAAGKYGTTCESDCPGKYCLENKCHRQMGNCELGCLDRYHGQYCTELCDCDFTGTTSCDQNTGNCNCQIGRYGQRCSQTCSNGCIGFRCEKDGQCSAGCNAGRYGIMCDNECNTCVNQACSEGDGTCRQGCVDGWYGTRCDIRCPAACKSCDSSGTCTKCVTSNYGLPDCTGVCSGQCKPNGGDRTCQENSGACIFGCQDGYYGSKCDQACGFCRDAVCQSDGSCQVCIGGYYGRDCKQSCSINCNRGGGSNTNECNQNSGVCTYGCVDGYFGNSCTSECSDNCLNKKCTSRTSCTDGCIAFQYGAGCQQSCPNCNRGNCDDDGFCLEGCSDGFFGQKCTKVCLETCLDDACDVTSGRCADCGTTPKGLKCRIQETPAAVTQEESERLSIGAVAGIAAGCVFVVIVFVILFVCCINYKRKADDAKNEIHLPSDVLERLSTHRSLHSTVSTNYPVARVVGDDQKDFVLF